MSEITHIKVKDWCEGELNIKDAVRHHARVVYLELIVGVFTLLMNGHRKVIIGDDRGPATLVTSSRSLEAHF
jgi:hypothetical protein